MKECRKELLRRWWLLPEVEKNSFTLSPQQIHCICQKTYQFFFEMKEGYKVSYVKILMFC